MEELFLEFEKKQEEFHEVIEKHPLLIDDLNKIFDEDIEEIGKLLDKDDEYYLKKAIKNLTYLIEDVKEISTKTKKAFKRYEELTKIWGSIEINDKITEKTLNKLNDNVAMANELITGTNLKSAEEAVIIFEKTIKELKEYVK